MTQEKIEHKIFFNNLQSFWLDDSSEPFSDRVLELAYEPVHVGRIENPDAVGTIKDDCGDVFELFLKIDDGKIANALFLSDGCGAIMACGSAVCELAVGLSIGEADKLSSKDITDYLDGLPSSHQHCAEQAVQALRKALDHQTEKPKWKS